MNKQEYCKYIKSKEWAKVRQLILKQRKVCEKCGTKSRLHIHHLTYVRLGKELPEDLVVLCRPCHEIAHGRKFYQVNYDDVKNNRYNVYGKLTAELIAANVTWEQKEQIAAKMPVVARVIKV